MLDNIKPAPSRSEEIAATLRDEILRGQYRVGERLPSERDLCSRFEASRGAVREAFKKLEQLGITSIQPGGSRVAAIEDCTLDVLGPLLDVSDVPDAKLVDEVMHMFGILLDTAARKAMETATEPELARAQELVDEILRDDIDAVEQHMAMRRLCMYFVELADHLVLRLTINGLRTPVLSRMPLQQMRSKMNEPEAREIRRAFAGEIRQALRQRDGAAVGEAMLRLNRMMRQRVATMLAAAADSPRRAQL